MEDCSSLHMKKIRALTTKGFMEADDLANNAGSIAKPVNYTIISFKTVYNTDNNRSSIPAVSVLRKICVKSYVRCIKKYSFRRKTEKLFFLRVLKDHLRYMTRVYLIYYSKRLAVYSYPL